MDYREKNFIEKFRSASQYLNCKPDDIISIKFRDIVNDHSDYIAFSDHLHHNNNLSIQALNGNFQGNAFLIPYNHSKIIYVEHETGLEILYIAGSIASIIGLIPIVIQVWKFIRNKNVRHGRDPIEKIETRYLDKNGELIQEEDSRFDDEFSNLLSILSRDLERNNLATPNYGKEIEEMKTRIKKLENKFNRYIKSKKE